jgi:hypothetical protein
MCTSIIEVIGAEGMAKRGARAGIELTLECAKELLGALERAIAAAALEEAEVRGKGAPRLVRAA